MIPKLPRLAPLHVDDLLDQHMSFYGGMTSDNLRRSLPQRLPQRLLQSALPQQAQPAQPAPPPVVQRPLATGKS
ncbi:hypothetical protein GCM10008965_46300 [Methylorubrum aminovorans]|jgi:hypothetical protein